MKTCGLISVLFITSSLMAAPVIFTSQARQTSLIELYTSEGCSSCPPAERRLNDLEHHPGLWNDFVPVAFHIDYWDYLGWPDRFSSGAHTARQQHYSKYWKSRTIYTPCFVKNGQAVRSFNPRAASGTPGILSAGVDGRSVQVRFSPATPSAEKWTVWLAPLSGKEITTVQSGENQGRTLEHCFVALGLSTTNLTTEGKTFAAELTLDRKSDPKAIAVWVSNSLSIEPIQATGGWLK